MSKDQTIGAATLTVCLAIALFYVVTLFYPQWLNVMGVQVTEANVQFWLIAVPVFIAFVAVMGIGAWIGWTMVTTRPPKPIEDITSETEKPEEKQPPSN